jgi:hypothetical protein
MFVFPLINHIGITEAAGRGANSIPGKYRGDPYKLAYKYFLNIFPEIYISFSNLLIKRENDSTLNAQNASLWNAKNNGWFSATYDLKGDFSLKLLLIK